MECLMRKTTLTTFLTASLQRKLMLALMALVTVVMGAAGIYLLNSQQQSRVGRTGGARRFT